MHDDPQTSREPDFEGSPEDGREEQWLSYAELGRVRGIGRESAKKLALREGWRRIPGNDGATRVLVPAEWLKPAREPSRGRGREPSRDTAAFETALTAIEAAHASEVAALRTQTDTSEQGRLAAQALADAALASIADMGGRVERAEAAVAEERSRADRAERSLAVARHDTQAAQQAAVELRMAEEGPEGEGAPAPRLGRLAGAVRPPCLRPDRI